MATLVADLMFTRHGRSPSSDRGKTVSVPAAAVAVAISTRAQPPLLASGGAGAKSEQAADLELDAIEEEFRGKRAASGTISRRRVSPARCRARRAEP